MRETCAAPGSKSFRFLSWGKFPAPHTNCLDVADPYFVRYLPKCEANLTSHLRPSPIVSPSLRFTGLMGIKCFPIAAVLKTRYFYHVNMKCRSLLRLEAILLPVVSDD
jgi:hypothetical protein